MKRKLLLPILSVCMVVALVSVGFAAWLITGADTSDDAQGQFITYGVSNEYFVVTISPTAESENKIVFGTPTDYTQTKTDWFQFDNSKEGDKQNLEKEFTVKLTFDDTNITNDQIRSVLKKWNISLTMTTTDGEAKAYATAINNKYITQPKFTMGGTEKTATGDTILGDTGMKITLTNTETDTDFAAADDDIKTESGTNKKYVEAKVKVAFAWGTAFNSNNPYTYFMGANFDDDATTGYKAGEKKYDGLEEEGKTKLRAYAQTTIGNLAKLNAQKFTIKLGADVKAV